MPPRTTPGATRHRPVSGAGLIAAAYGVMNVCTYVFTWQAARALGPSRYGALASLMATLLVVGVLQLGLQAATARAIAVHPDQAGAIRRAALGVGLRWSAAAGVLLLVASPLVDLVLHLDSVGTAMALAVGAVPMTYTGAQLGVLQGQRRWRPLAAAYLVTGLGRVAIGGAVLWLQPQVWTALLAVAASQWLPALIAGWALRHTPAPHEPPPGAPTFSLGVESLHSSHLLLAFFALANTDVVVARIAFPGHAAGLYAGGLILAKAMLFLPQFVVIVAFPSMSTAAERRRALGASLGLVSALGLVGALAALALPDLALVFVGGEKYGDIAGSLWLFAVLGTLLSLLQLLVYSALAERARHTVLIVWATLAVVAALGALTDAPRHLLAVVLACDVVLLILLAVRTARSHRLATLQ
ncbi:MAG: oligosaccharide flippase family protein [Nocardioides sp.]